jgi:predicted enzyme related to lactoylglutathione lyase
MQHTTQHVNAISWFEIPVTAMDRAQRFYEHMLGKTLQREQFPMDGQTYTLAIFPTVGEGAKGCLQSGADTTLPSTQGTLVYLDCSPGIDGAVARAQSLGGIVLRPKTALPPGMGFIATIEDLDGNRIGLHAMA